MCAKWVSKCPSSWYTWVPVCWEWLSKVDNRASAVSLNVFRRRGMTNLVCSWTFMLQRVYVCFLCVSWTEAVLCQSFLYACDGLALVCSPCYISSPATVCVCSTRSTYDEEVAAVWRRPCTSLMQILWCMCSGKDGIAVRYWSIKEAGTMRHVSLSVIMLSLWLLQ